MHTMVSNIRSNTATCSYCLLSINGVVIFVYTANSYRETPLLTTDPSIHVTVITLPVSLSKLWVYAGFYSTTDLPVGHVCGPLRP
jgi:hypothetical protein